MAIVYTYCSRQICDARRRVVQISNLLKSKWNYPYARAALMLAVTSFSGSTISAIVTLGLKNAEGIDHRLVFAMLLGLVFLFVGMLAVLFVSLGRQWRAEVSLINGTLSKYKSRARACKPSIDSCEFGGDPSFVSELDELQEQVRAIKPEIWRFK